MTTAALRDTGIEVIGQAPWGTHLCQFYETTEDLVDILVPYFKAGLAGNEFCTWVTSPPLDRDAAEKALRKALPDLDRYLEKRQIEILSYDKWYLEGGSFDSQRVLDGWVAKVEEAQARGFEGLRLSGNTFWLEKIHWDDFAAYEGAVNNVIADYNMIALCTYSLEKCGAPEIVDVISTHQFALVKREGRWETIESAERRRLDEVRRQTEATLREREADLNRAQAVSHTGSWRLDVQTDVLEWSEGSHRIFGIPTGTRLTYEAFLALVHPEDRQKVDEAWQAAMHGAPYDIDHRSIVDGKVKWIRERAELEFDANGELRGGFGTCHDITERKQAEEELRKANAIKDDFVAMVSHEMRTPLTAIMAGASLLLNSDSLSGGDRRELTGEIRVGAQRLATIIDNMLSLARAHARKPELGPLAIDGVIDDVIMKHRDRYGTREVHKRVVTDTPVAVASKEYVVHVLSNLLENSEKYTPHDGAIEVEVRREGDELAIRVLDRGIGLKPEEAESIFEPFYRSPRVDKLSPGVGIGLTVSKRLVEAMGGRIWAASREGGGCEFGFSLAAAAPSA
jgi:PAS domain S-box-containing protein